MQTKILREKIGTRRHMRRTEESSKKASLPLHFSSKVASRLQQTDNTRSQSRARLRARQPSPSQLRRYKRSKPPLSERDEEGIYSGEALNRRRRRVEGESENRKGDAGVFCVCRGADDGTSPMVQCDHCRDWFHFSCVHISDEEVPQIYRCPNCKSKTQQNFPTRGVSSLDLLILAAENLARNETAEMKSENSESKGKTKDELKDNSQESKEEEVEGRGGELRLGRTGKLVLEHPKYACL
eukprot:TRINITY_DN4247_c0_g3_i2.p1 TRINITY_DN4247_c0_g3~~TRINITY_DN4247_c0_g3_i2.p1  ORF type:complete len:240 (+),score=25.90 TRINITY_DN4247_c0_g3_i2:217-936(+)